MHILLIHQIFTTPEGSGGTRHYEFAKILVNKGHCITVIASCVNYLSGNKIQKKSEHRDGIEIIYVYAYKHFHQSFFYRGINFFLFSIFSFFEAMKIKNIDLVWGTSPPLFQALTALFVAKLKNASFIFEVRDLWIDFAVELGILKNQMLINILRKLEKLIYKNADRIIVNSPGFIPFVSQYVDKNKIFLIPNSVVTDDFEVSAGKRVEFRKKSGLLDDFIVMYIGNIGVANDMGTIIDSAQILKGYSDIKFVLIGGGIKKDKCKEELKRRDLDNIIIIDAQPKKNMPVILSSADVCIATLKSTSLFKTTYPNKVFDYMAAAKPVILAIDGVIKEVIKEANAGICINPGNAKEVAGAILKYYQSPELKKVHGVKGKEYVKKNFERKMIAEKLEDVFKKMRD